MSVQSQIDRISGEVETQKDLISQISATLAGKAGATGGIVPSGTKTITENGTYDVTSYASAEVNVSTDGVIVQRVSGSCVSPAMFQVTTVDVGFKPDIVTFPDFGVITSNVIKNTTSSATAFFAESNNYNGTIQMICSESDVAYRITVRQKENGFAFNVREHDIDLNVEGKTINYVAIKYTSDSAVTPLDLYNNGDTCNDVTGGWFAEAYSTNGRPNVGNASISLSYDAVDNAWTTVGTNNSIDMSGYKTLNFDMLVGSHLNSSGGQAVVGVTENKPVANEYTTAIGGVNTFVAKTFPTVDGIERIVSVNISDVDSGYVAIYGIMNAIIYRVWLE